MNRYLDDTTLPDHAPEPSERFLGFARDCRDLLSHYAPDEHGTMRHRTRPVHHFAKQRRRHPIQEFSDMRLAQAAMETWMSTSQSGAFPCFRGSR